MRNQDAICTQNEATFRELPVIEVYSHQVTPQYTPSLHSSPQFGVVTSSVSKLGFPNNFISFWFRSKENLKNLPPVK